MHDVMSVMHLQRSDDGPQTTPKRGIVDAQQTEAPRRAVLRKMQYDTKL